MFGPFGTSLRAKIHGSTLFLILGLLVLAVYGSTIGLKRASENGFRLASAFAPNATSVATSEALRAPSEAALGSSLRKIFEVQKGIVHYAVVKSSTGEIVAATTPEIEQIPAVLWKELAQKRGVEQQAVTCTRLRLAPAAALVAPVTNILWNMVDPRTSCHGTSIRTAELVSVGRLPKGQSGRTIIPMADTYLVAALVLAGILVTLAAMAFMSLIVHRRVVLPLAKIKQGAIIMAQGNLSHQIIIPNRDEIGVVANFINEVGRNLQVVRAELIDRQRIASELDAAAKIQQHLLPSEIPHVPGLNIAARTRPSTEVGGDNYDFIQLDEENLIFFVGDVTGHGVPAGLVMIMIDVLIDTFSSMYKSPKDILVNVNRFLTPNIDSTMYMTMIMFGFNIKTQKLRYASAGHEHIVIYHAKTRRCTTTRSGGIALGMIPDIEHLMKETEVPLEQGDVIVLYSDGITEAYGGHEGKQMFGLENLVQHVEKVGYRDAQAIFDHVTRALADFMGNAPQNDDITLMVLKYTGATQDDIQKASKRIKISVAEGEKKAAGSKRWDWDKKVAS